jgi:alpha-D-ribose 1-methylphosphonate 5-triphosphate synthase subunit PhnG
MAVCDAILDNSLPETAEVLALVQTGLDRIQARHRQRRAMLERTRVDFDLLAKDTEGSDED